MRAAIFPGSSGRYTMMMFSTNAAAATDLAESDDEERLQKMRNIGISAHIDSGKTTLTERILFYTGRIDSIHEVRGKDGVGAKMDSMELEREKGITIQSAATYTSWGDYNINIIDTPGHVDFTVEVERALRVLDGAIMVLCSVAGVQSQSITVDRQMKRYDVPRLAFVNKCDRMGANPMRVIDDVRAKLRLHAAAVQIPIGLEADLEGVVDLVTMQAYYNVGEHGETVETRDIPEDLVEEAVAKRAELIEAVASVDEELEEVFIMDEEPSVEQLEGAIRRATLALQFVPVFMGSAFKNRGVQPLLDGVTTYLPNPGEVTNVGLDQNDGEAKTVLSSNSSDDLVALAFKLEESRFGQLTYMRVYQGTLKQGSFIQNMSGDGKKLKLPRLVRMHSNDMEDVESVGAGEICATFGLDCSSGDTFCATDGSTAVTMESMFVPSPVVSLSVKPKNPTDPKFGKALNRFTREDPTFRQHLDPESKETIISGMGELHLEVYVERMLREYGVECVTGMPQVNYREAIAKKASFDYLHKKQTGGSGQYGKVQGYIEPLSDEEYEEALAEGKTMVFENQILGNAIPPEFIGAVEKGAQEAMDQGALVGHPVQGVRFVLEDGAAHAVDSSELAFRAAAIGAFREAYAAAGPQVLEPVMAVEVEAPTEFQGGVMGELNKRKGQIQDTEIREDTFLAKVEVPLEALFGLLEQKWSAGL